MGSELLRILFLYLINIALIREILQEGISEVSASWS